MKNLPDNYKTFCRACFKPLKFGVSSKSNLFHKSMAKNSLSNKFTTCTSIKISPDDNLPQYICGVCTNWINLGYRFRKTCLHSDQKFKVILESSESKDCAAFIGNANDECTSNIVVQETLEPEFIQVEFENDAEIAECTSNIVKQENLESKCIIYVNKLEDLVSEIEIETTKIESMSNNLQVPNTTVELQSKTIKNTILFATQLQLPTFKCEICENTFNEIPMLDRHMKSEHNHKCTYCKQRFTTQEKLDEHKKSRHNGQLVKKKLRTCAICEETFNSRKLYVDHVKINHSDEAAYGCIYCEEKLYSYMELHNHIRAHTDKISFLCPTCGKFFLNKHLLQEHLKRHAERERFKCDKCPLTYLSKRKLMIHVVSCHTDEKPFKCDICEKCFSHKNNIIMHMRVHGGGPSLVSCPFCPKKVTKLSIHLRTHTGEKPYKCKYCGIAYQQSSDLNKHLRKHVGDNIYKCNECTETFRYWRDLVAHQNQHFINNKLNSSNVQMVDASV